MKDGDGAGLGCGATAAAVLCSLLADSFESCVLGGCVEGRCLGRAAAGLEEEKFRALLTARMAVLDCRAVLIVTSRPRRCCLGYTALVASTIGVTSGV